MSAIKSDDSYYNTVVLASLTSSCSIEGANKRLEGHTVQRDSLGNVVSVDDRAIAAYPCIYFFHDGRDLDGNPAPNAAEYRRLRTRKDYRILVNCDARQAAQRTENVAGAILEDIEGLEAENVKPVAAELTKIDGDNFTFEG